METESYYRRLAARFALFARYAVAMLALFAVTTTWMLWAGQWVESAALAVVCACQVYWLVKMLRYRRRALADAEEARPKLTFAEIRMWQDGIARRDVQ